MKAIHLREQGSTFNAIANTLDIINRSQAKQWWDWYKVGELNRFVQPIRKQYSYGRGPEGKTIKRETHYKGKESIVANNLIDREFRAERPLEKRVTDITYLPWGEKRLYLFSIMD